MTGNLPTKNISNCLVKAWMHIHKYARIYKLDYPAGLSHMFVFRSLPI